MKGIIKKLVYKGFGFIKVEDSERDIFFHTSGLKEVSFNDLKEGDEVSFDIAEGEKGKFAENIERV